MIKTIFEQLLEPIPPKPTLLLPIPHSLILQIESSKFYPPLLKTLQGINQLLHAPNSIFESFKVKGAIVSGRIMSSERLEHVCIIWRCSFCHCICSPCLCNKSSRLVRSIPNGRLVSPILFIIPPPFLQRRASNLSLRPAIEISKSNQVLDLD